ncbi:MarR family transcriptional regulator [Mesorhizobium sp. CAU 1732]|uniref:MarR family winged helix-turn-helix transcriptional regulator n=1 Tax=Mesorhizobium sp. CAU 1732 TaxID=3140358 RepID=UPI003260B9E7
MQSGDKEAASACNCQTLRMAARYTTAVYDKALSPSGLRVTQFTILYRLRQRGPMEVKPLAASMAMDRTTLAANLKPLERDGLVRLTVNPSDRRARLIEITEDGAGRVETCVPLWRAAQKSFEQSYGAAKAATMRSLMADVLKTGLEPWAE